LTPLLRLAQRPASSIVFVALERFRLADVEIFLPAPAHTAGRGLKSTTFVPSCNAITALGTVSLTSTSPPGPSTMKRGRSNPAAYSSTEKPAGTLICASAGGARWLVRSGSVGLRQHYGRKEARREVISRVLGYHSTGCCMALPGSVNGRRGKNKLCRNGYGGIRSQHAFPQTNSRSRKRSHSRI
jgi:hypothetical protein